MKSIHGHIYPKWNMHTCHFHKISVAASSCTLRFPSKSVVWIIHLFKGRKSDGSGGVDNQQEKQKDLVPFTSYHHSPPCGIRFSWLSTPQPTASVLKNITSPPCVRENYAKPTWKKLSNYCWHPISKPGREHRVAFCLGPNEVPLVKRMPTKNLSQHALFPLFHWTLLGISPLFYVEDMKHSGGRNPVCTGWHVSLLCNIDELPHLISGKGSYNFMEGIYRIACPAPLALSSESSFSHF